MTLFGLTRSHLSNTEQQILQVPEVGSIMSLHDKFISIFKGYCLALFSETQEIYRSSNMGAIKSGKT